MEVYLLNDNFTNNHLIENYESLVWTERFNKVGDFELDLLYTPELRRLLRKGRYIGLDVSLRVMQIETVNEKRDEQNVWKIKVTGRSLEKIFERRTAWPNKHALGEEPSWTRTDTPRHIVSRAINRAMITAHDPTENVSYYHEGSLFPFGNNQEYLETIDYTITKPMSTSEYIKDLVEAYKIGYRIYRDPTLDRIYVNTYVGDDRTTSQTVHNPVIFSDDLENIEDTEIVESQEALVNRVQVFSKHGYSEVFREDVEGGWDYKSIVIDVTEPDEAETDQQKNDYRIQKGLEELLKHDYTEVMDCEISSRNGYVYGQDYNLGDLVDVQAHTGDINRMRVIEQIFTSDDNGDRSYPTLETETLIKRNTWAGTDPAETWQDAIGTWDDRI